MSSLDLPLGDLVQKNNRPRGRGGRGGSRGGRGGSHSNGDSAGPQRNQKRYSQANFQSKPYQRAYVPQYVPQTQYVPVQAGLFGSTAPAGGQWTHDLYASEAPVQQQPPQPQQPVKKIQGDTIHVSNLAADVTDDDVREIFERIGTVRSCTVNFNSQGVSTGTATVTFARHTDAEKAVDEYDEAEVDGRVMKLKLVGSVVTAPVIVKKNKPPQVVPQQQQPVFVQAPIQFHQPQPMQYQTFKQPKPQKQVVSRGASKGAARGGRGGAAAPSKPARGGATGTRGGRGGAKKPATAEDLDKEMDSYHTAAAPPSAAAAGQPTTV